MNMRFVFRWEIVMMNDVMGFQRRFSVEGMNHRDAIERACGELSEKGYDPEDFSVIELSRKNIVRRVEAA